MPLNASTLESALVGPLTSTIRSELDSHLPLPADRGAASSDRDEVCSALAQAIAKEVATAVVAHVVANGLVTGAPGSVTGISPPGMAGGPITAGALTGGTIS